jgi:histidinol-phosphatase
MAYERELGIARLAAHKAGDIQLAGRRNHGGITLKTDSSPVTAIDLASENAISETLLAAFPGDGFLGEESGGMAGTSGRRWIVDPLDGTRPFIHGLPTFSSLIALEEDNNIVVGVMHLPAMQETYWAAAGGGAFCNGVPLRVSSTKTISAAFASALGFVEKAATSDGQRLLGCMRQWDYCYGFMDAYSYGCVAAGCLDACVNLLDKPWDCAAAACIVVEAGGRYSDLRGNQTVHGGTIILSNGFLHDTLVEYFQERM